MKPFLAAVAALFVLATPTFAGQGKPLGQMPGPGTRSEAFSDHSTRLTKASMGLSDMERALVPGSPGATAAEGLANVADFAAEYMSAFGVMAYLWEEGGKGVYGKMRLQAEIGFYVGKLELRIKQANLYIAHAPAGVAAAGLELRKQLEEAIRLLRNYRP